MPVSELSRIDRPALEHHLLALDPHDRRLRFGTLLRRRGASRTRRHARSQFGRDDAFHALPAGKPHDDASGAQGSARIITEQGEAQAWLALAPADAASHFGEVFAQRAALFDYALKSTVAAVTRR